MNTQDQLHQVFADNFVAYYRSHVAHVNTVGRNFVSDHKLLGKIYEDLQTQIDSIAELLRTVGEFMPASLAEVMGKTQITDMDCEGTADELLLLVRDDLLELKMTYEQLMVTAESDGHMEIANYAQDRILTLAKYIWMLESTVD